LFESKGITQLVGDAFELVKDFGGAEFGVVYHDPPRFSFAGELYSGAFYRELFRVMKRGGRLFHYTGTPNERKGKSFLKGVKRRLVESGFSDVKWVERCLGFTAVKQGF